MAGGVADLLLFRFFFWLFSFVRLSGRFRLGVHLLFFQRSPPGLDSSHTLSLWFHFLTVHTLSPTLHLVPSAGTPRCCFPGLYRLHFPASYHLSPDRPLHKPKKSHCIQSRHQYERSSIATARTTAVLPAIIDLVCPISSARWSAPPAPWKIQ